MFEKVKKYLPYIVIGALIVYAANNVGIVKRWIGPKA